MEMRIVARCAWMGLGLALCLGALEVGATDSTATVAQKPSKTSAPKPVTPEQKAKREKVMEVEKVAKDFSAKRDAVRLNEARERDNKRRDEEAAAKSPRVEPSDSGQEDSVKTKARQGQ